MLSGGAANEMRDQLRKNNDNQKSTGAVMGDLLGTRPAP
jgi:hypothetical protein